MFTNCNCICYTPCICTYMLFKNINIKIYRTVILPLVLYGCETWSLTLREVHRLRVLCFVDRESWYNSCKQPTWRTIIFSTRLFQFSTCFEQPRAHHQENQLYHYDIWYMSLRVGDRLVCKSGSSLPTCIE